VDHPVDRFVDEVRREQQQRDAVRLGGQDLDPLEAVGVSAGRRAGREPDRDQREHDGDRVGEHVCRVSDQGQRSGRDTDEDFGDHEADDQRQRAAQQLAVCCRTRTMPVARAHDPDLSGWMASVCSVCATARSTSIRTCASSRR
jgi:hypothetical protein